MVTTYPAWFSIFCLLLAGAYAFLLYRFDPRTKEFPPRVKGLLAFFRFLLVLLLAFLLLRPLLRTQESEVEEPLIAVLQDVSASIPLGGDSAFYADAYPQKLKALNEKLARSYKLRRFSFGKELRDSISTGFSAKQTDIAGALQGIQERFKDRNLGGVVLATDGIYNTGADPRYYADRMEAPVHCIALGDTTVRRDLIVKDLVHNRYAYQGNRFPIEAAVRARKAKGKESVLTISHNGEELYRKELRFDREEDLQVEKTTLPADSAGLQRYVVNVRPVDGEVSEKNNRKAFFIEVLESKRKVLALAHAPHPDIRALKGAIEKKNSYKVNTELVDDFEGKIEGHDLLILHQLPSGEDGMSAMLEEARERNISVLFVCGSSTSYDDLSGFIPGLRIYAKKGRTDQASPVLDPNFDHFDIGEVGKRVSGWPPLTVPFGKWEIGKGLETLFTKKVGQVKVKEPLWAFSKDGEQKLGVITGEGLWRWRLRDMAENGNTEGFQKLVGKTVQYLSVKEDKSRFRVEGDKEYRENETITFTAELYDRSYELMNEPRVKMKIRNEEGKTYPFSFSRTSSGYRLEAGMLPTGDYQWEAKAALEEDTLTERGRFTVTPVRIERARTVADHGLLYDLARRTGGTVSYPDAMESIPDSIESSGTAKPVRYTQERMTDLISWKWLFLPLLLLMSIEWFLRKRMGAY